MTEKKTGSLLWSLLFFPIMILYEELLLRVFAAKMPIWDYHTLLIAAFSISAGLMIWLLISFLPSQKTRTAAAVTIAVVLAVVFSIEYGSKQYYGTFFAFSFMMSMAGDVAGQFAEETVKGVINTLPFAAVALVPPVLLIIFRKKMFSRSAGKTTRLAVLSAALLLHYATTFPILLPTNRFIEDSSAFTSEYSANTALPRFGALTTLSLEALYGITGVPESELLQAPTDIGDPNGGDQQSDPTDYGSKEYDYNVMDIDFDALIASSPNNTITGLHQYFSTVAPTQKNEYTGMFKDKNLILLCCEAFTPYVIDPELTPLLYKMSTEGFVFNNFYQPDWTQSTTGGEAAELLGIVPMWLNAGYTLAATYKNDFPFALGNQFRELGYATRAYHNHLYTYYDRHKSHPNLGYDFKAMSSGLVLENEDWPNSDVEMMKATVDEYIDNYVNKGEKFHTYYMTVSGHAGYAWLSNGMSDKHRDKVEHLEQYSPNVQAYIACQLEVEYALQYLMEKLEAAGIAEDTVIAFSADHYPYALTTKYYNELQPEPTTVKDLDHFRNAFILWSACMTEPVVVNSPGSTIDMVPTLSNLFGLEYDSRLLSGRDLLATNYDVADVNSRQPLVIFPDKGTGCSWISEAGQYNSETKKFTPAEGYEEYAENKEYLSAMSAKAKNMTTAARGLLAENYFSIVFPKATEE